MKEYVLYYVQQFADFSEEQLFWRCQADNYDHAVEQLQNAIDSESNSKLVFVEHYKN